jgi:hypothetical protein
VEAEQAGSPHPALLEVILRDATAADDAALASFDPGSGTPWLDEVIEIVAVAAHERLEHERVGVLSAHRYLMVAAVRQDRQRTGLARTITEAVVAEMQSDGVQSVSWLVHPRNAASIEFSRRVFPEADDEARSALRTVPVCATP